MLKTCPAVFAVGNDYQIMVEVTEESLMYVQIGEETYYDETNGIMNSLSSIHRVTVPMELLDREKAYTVYIRPIIERKAYFTPTKEPVAYPFSFRPVPDTNIRVYHLSDTHNQIDLPVSAAQAFGNLDLLILNGDIIEHSGNPEKFANIYEICSRITGGTIPTVFSRGNHDMRGQYAENFADYTPNQQGRTYYTFRLNSLWGILLDCGEDKDDSSSEYGFTVACHHFREKQTSYIKDVIRNAQNEYAHEAVKTRLVISHIPFTRQLEPPFNIEADTYSQWAALLKEHIKPNLMICGHMHQCSIYRVGGEIDHLGQPCPVVTASAPQENTFIGGGFIIGDDQIEVLFTDSTGNIHGSETFQK